VESVIVFKTKDSLKWIFNKVAQVSCCR